jgi:hypothetical protein
MMMMWSIEPAARVALLGVGEPPAVAGVASFEIDGP